MLTTKTTAKRIKILIGVSLSYFGAFENHRGGKGTTSSGELEE
jgi:hypothetical protein